MGYVGNSGLYCAPGNAIDASARYDDAGATAKALAEGNNPADPLAQGAMILVAGVLLLTPGFFTDSIGFYC